MRIGGRLTDGSFRTWLKYSRLTLTRIFYNIGYQLWFGIRRLITFALEFSLGIFRFGIFAWDLSRRIFAWEFSLDNFRFCSNAVLLAFVVYARGLFMIFILLGSLVYFRSIAQMPWTCGICRWPLHQPIYVWEWLEIWIWRWSDDAGWQLVSERWSMACHPVCVMARGAGG